MKSALRSTGCYPTIDPPRPRGTTEGRVSRERIDVSTTSATYPIFIATGLASRLAAELDEAGVPSRRVIVSSPTVWHHVGNTITAALPETPLILVPDGERAKHTKTVGRIYDGLMDVNADRGSVVVAIGGGVIGDMAGFAAASWLRGIPVVQVPTTLLAQVDSAVGGKVGVNHPLGKNMIGAFHQPRLVAVDPLLLGTLPRREFRAGLYEVVKYGMAFDAALFAEVSAHVGPIFKHDPAVLTSIIAASCRIKARVVGEDERERGPRRLLNFGHTAGHAFESITNYRRFRHGEAIAWGMLVAADLSAARGVLPANARDALAALIRTLGPLPPVADLRVDAVVEATRRDKKVVDGHLHFVVATALGQSAVVPDVTEDELRAALVRVGLRD
jgi:3-dehydroquinate synthase